MPTAGNSGLDSLVLTSIAKRGGAGPLRAALAEGLKSRIDEPCADRDTLLTLAARHGNTECVRLLLQEGASVDAPSAKPSATPLYLACQEGNPQVARLLLEAKADVTDVIGDGLTPLSIAVHQGGADHAECARLLLTSPQHAQVGAKKLDDCDQNGVNLLLKASFMGHEGIVGHLLKAGCSAKHVDSTGASALIVACRKGHHKVVRQLVKAGAPLDSSVSDGGGSALHFACGAGKGAGASECVKLVLGAKANPSSTTANGVTPLHVACQNGQLECAKLLIAARAQINAIDKDGVPPLFLAETQNHKDIVTLLKSNGATVLEPPEAKATGWFGS